MFGERALNVVQNNPEMSCHLFFLTQLKKIKLLFTSHLCKAENENKIQCTLNSNEKKERKRINEVILNFAK